MATDDGYRTIKALVIDFVHRHDGKVDFGALTQEVTRRFPDSRWKRTHWAWYRHQILHGRFKDLFSAQEREALAGKAGAGIATAPPTTEPQDAVEALARGPQAKNPEIKRIGDGLLNHIRMVIGLAAGDNVTKHFKLNRWVFSRLLQDEIRVKRPIKQALWKNGIHSCQACGEAFASLKGVEIHRKDESQGYSTGNCELLCRECHQELG